MKKIFFPLLVTLVIFQSCTSSDTADIILINGNIYTVDAAKPRVEAIAIKGDRIVKTGTTAEIERMKGEKTEVVDLNGQFVMPGFIEGHGHFSGLGASLMNLNFLKSKSWNEIVQAVGEKAKSTKPGAWITGRGWHQEKWTEPLDQQEQGYPYHDLLSEASPDHPVLLRHASGHSLFANKKAMELAGISAETPDPSGGRIVRNARGEAIGVFEERAMSLINTAYQEYLDGLSESDLKEQWLKGIELAEEECLKKGITSFQDAGSSFEEIGRYRELAEKGELDLRLWAMLRHSYADMKDQLDGFPMLNLGNHTFTCRAIKSEVDGALGAFGAWLLRPYADKPGFEGQNTTPVSEVQNIARLAMNHDLQLCVHAIGDRANRVTLNIYEELFKANAGKTNLRWRIEHAQHLDTADIPRFKRMGVIASMQGIHCTSDAPFVVKRLGETRSRLGAYPWRSLLDAGVLVANGTDAPVEDVSPIESFYASVTRKRADTGLVFFPEQRMTREEALYSYTMANAYAAFEESLKGSLTQGKLADLVVLSEDLVQCDDDAILKTKVVMTMVGGKVKYKE
ncbi:MAG: amidohydrolase [Saprospiraceae bacterium]|nr:amidohydrolase [Saprospiraceae bacterium]